jgi:Type II secretion system (T2SS), protein E, N-terminal domain
MPSDMKPRRQPLLAHLLVKQGLITQAQLREALQAQAEAQAEARAPVPLEQVLTERKLVTAAQLSGVLDSYQTRFRLGRMLIEMKLLNEEQLRQALQEQQRTGVRLGDALLKLNLLTERQIRHALCRQFDVALVDLDKVTLDPELSQLVGKRYAQQHRVIPIAREESRLTVAMDDPGDLEVVDDLAAYTGCEITVVTSTLAAFQRAFLRAYGDVQGAGAGVPAPPGRPEAADADAVTRLREERDALARAHEEEAQARQELAAQRDETLRALDDLRAAHEALRAEYDARTQALQKLEEQHAATLRDLDEARAAHEALEAEHHAATMGTFRELASRTLAELEAAQSARREAETRLAQALRALATLHPAPTLKPADQPR